MSKLRINLRYFHQITENERHNCVTEEQIGLKHLKVSYLRLKPSEKRRSNAIILADSKDMQHKTNSTDQYSEYKIRIY